MISWLNGKIIHMENQMITLNVNGVGYHVLVGSNTFTQLFNQYENSSDNLSIQLIIYTQVKEDEILLIGFDSFITRRLFLLFLTVNGVGAKAALSIVDQLTLSKIYTAIQQHNPQPFLDVPGIGKKTAQRILLELEEKIQNADFIISSELKSLVHQQPLEGNSYSTIKKDALSALMNLGFNEKIILKILETHYTPDIDLDTLIRKSLNDLHR